MDPVLQSLIRYQELSLELNRLNAQLAQYPLQIQAIDAEVEAEIVQTAKGQTLSQIAASLLDAVDPDKISDAAKAELLGRESARALTHFSGNRTRRPNRVPPDMASHSSLHSNHSSFRRPNSAIRGRSTWTSFPSPKPSR